MKNLFVLFLLLSVVGCGNPEVDLAEVYPGVSQDQLVPTLNQIAETGEYQTVLMDLTVGLEKAGYMNQAATVQKFESLSDKEEIKKLAATVAESLEKS